MNWSAIQAAIKAAVVAATGIPAQRVQWVNTPQAGTWREYPCVDLVLRNPVGLGTDSFVRTDVLTTDTPITITQVGPRQFQVDVRVESTDQNPGADSVGHLASDLRTRIRRPAILAGLSVAGVALATIGPTQDADFASDDRMHSLSVTTVLFNAAETEVDTSDPGDYFNRMELDSDKLRSPDGSDAPEQIDLTVGPP